MTTTEKVYQYIEAYIDKQQMPPTLREIAKGCNLKSSSTVIRHLDRLEAQGRIYRPPGKARSIRLITYNSFALEDMTQTIYDYIEHCIVMLKRPPTQVEIADTHHISTDTARRHLSILESSGKIWIDPKKARGIRLTNQNQK